MFVKEICSSFLVNEIADGKLNWSKMAGISGFSSSPAAPTSKSDAISSKNKPAVLTRAQNFRKNWPWYAKNQARETLLHLEQILTRLEGLRHLHVQVQRLPVEAASGKDERQGGRHPVLN